MPEVFLDGSPKNHGGSKKLPQDIMQLRIDFMNGATKEELEKKYNISKPNLRRILKIERWVTEDSIPKGYKDFINK